MAKETKEKYGYLLPKEAQAQPQKCHITRVHTNGAVMIKHGAIMEVRVGLVWGRRSMGSGKSNSSVEC
eukprot:scaffold29318_cov65-Attheya_sp.AAC.2